MLVVACTACALLSVNTPGGPAAGAQRCCGGAAACYPTRVCRRQCAAGAAGEYRRPVPRGGGAQPRPVGSMLLLLVVAVAEMTRYYVSDDECGRPKLAKDRSMLHVARTHARANGRLESIAIASKRSELARSPSTSIDNVCDAAACTPNTRTCVLL